MKYSIGDVVVVETKSGKSYSGVIIKTYPEKGSFWCRPLNGDKYKYRSWKRYDLSCGIYQEADDIAFITILSKPMTFFSISFKEQITSEIFFNTYPYPVTFCLLDRNGKRESGGWSFKESIIDAIKESSENAYKIYKM